MYFQGIHMYNTLMQIDQMAEQRKAGRYDVHRPPGGMCGTWQALATAKWWSR